MEEISFGPFVFRVDDLRLFRHGMDLGLRRQAARALKVLLENSGTSVDAQRLARLAWDAEVVGRHNLLVTIRDIKLAMGDCGGWISSTRDRGFCLTIPGTAELIRKGWHYWHQRTRDGFDKALECFCQAAIHDGSSGQAFGGMALSYLMLGTYGLRPPKEMYSKFLAAHDRAVRVTGLIPERRIDKAHGLHIFEHRHDDAEAELEKIRLEFPRAVTVYVCLAMLYGATARTDKALDALRAGREVDSLWPTLPALEVFVRFAARDYMGAIAAAKALDLHPFIILGLVYYAEALDFLGRADEALAQHKRNRELAPDIPWLLATEACCFARNGRRREAELKLAELEEIRSREYLDPYFLIRLREAMSDREGAIRELEHAIQENSATLFILDVDPHLDLLRTDPRFKRIRDELFGNSVK